MSRIRIHVPAVPDAGAEPATRAPRGRLTGPVPLVIIENGKPRARELLSLAAERVGARVPLADVEVHSKPTAAKPIDADTARLLAARSRLVITGLGD